MTKRTNDNLTREEAAAWRAIAARHGYTARTGPRAGEGSGMQLTLAIIAGEVRTVLLDPDDRAAVARWLEEQDAGPLTDALRSLAAQLHQDVL